MDERHLARLVDEVEQAFPGDPTAQREAWELLEAFSDAWDETGAADAGAGADAAIAGAADDRPTTLRRLLAACRELVRDTSGRVVSALDELVPPDPAYVLGHPQVTSGLTVDEEAAAELGVDPDVTVEVGPDFVTFVVGITESSTPERLAAVVLLPDAEPPDDRLVQRFARLDPTLATAYFDIRPTTEPVGLALVVFGPDEIS